MKYLLYYNVDNKFVSDQVKAGGDGTNVVSVVDGVAWSNDIEKIHFNPHDKTILTHQITVNYKNGAGTTVAPSETVSVDYISGTTPEVLLQAKEVENYIARKETIKVIVPNTNSVDFVYYSPKQVIPLTFNIISSGTIYWVASNTAISKTIEYSLDSGKTWSSITSNTGASAPSISVSTGDVVQFRGNNATYSSDGSRYNTFSGSTAKFEVEGNIMSLIDITDFTTATTLTSNYNFYNLFINCTGLTSAKNLVLPATTLEDSCYVNMFQGCTSLTTAPESLPATALAYRCYQSMFSNCTSLATAPALPANALATQCYQSMFSNCTSLTTAPELPATTLATNCYGSMFYGCTSLATAPELPATTLIGDCYNSMFRNCTSLTTAPELPATTLKDYCYNGMFLGCTSLNYIKCLATDISATNCTTNWTYGVKSTGTFVKDVSITGWTTGVNGIPFNWIVENYGFGLSRKSITFGEVSSAKTVTITSSFNNWTATTNDNWYGLSQYTGGTGDTTITITANTEDTFRTGTVTFTDGTNVAELTVNEKHPAEIPLTFNIISSGTIYWKASNSSYVKTIQYKKNDGDWANITSSTGNLAPSISVGAGDVIQFIGDNTAYGNGSNYNSFSGSTAKFEAEGNIMSLIDGTGFTTATIMTESYAFYGLFSNCTGLTSTENLILPATTLTNYCYMNMFSGCTSMGLTPFILPATALTMHCYQNMFIYCNNITQTPILPATTLATECYRSMFNRCASLVTPPVLPATSLGVGCYQNMFWGCSRLTTAPVLPATVLIGSCYESMFDGCTSLTTAPDLDASILVNRCYYYMFNRCSSLSYIKCTATNPTVGDAYTKQWVNGVSSTGTFVKNASVSINSWGWGQEGIPNGWTVEDAS